jgi:hypothetical protein
MIFKLLKESTNSFEGMHEHEQVLMLLREHWFVLYTRLAGVIIAAFLPVIVFPIAGIYATKYGLFGLFFFAVCLYYLLLWYTAFYILTMYSLNTMIVTTDRIINSTQNGFFDRNVSEVSLARIQDATFMMIGPIATFLKYGNIEVQSAGEQEKFIFKNIPDPEHVKEEIMRLSSQAHKDL